MVAIIVGLVLIAFTVFAALPGGLSWGAAKKWVEFFGRSFSLFTESLVSDIEQIFNIKLQWFDYIPGIGNITILAKQIVGIVKFLKNLLGVICYCITVSNSLGGTK